MEITPCIFIEKQLHFPKTSSYSQLCPEELKWLYRERNVFALRSTIVHCQVESSHVCTCQCPRPLLPATRNRAKAAETVDKSVVMCRVQTCRGRVINAISGRCDTVQDWNQGFSYGNRKAEGFRTERVEGFPGEPNSTLWIFNNLMQMIVTSLMI